MLVVPFMQNIPSCTFIVGQNYRFQLPEGARANRDTFLHNRQLFQRFAVVVVALLSKLLDSRIGVSAKKIISDEKINSWPSAEICPKEGWGGGHNGHIDITQ